MPPQTISWLFASSAVEQGDKLAEVLIAELHWRAAVSNFRVDRYAASSTERTVMLDQMTLVRLTGVNSQYQYAGLNRTTRVRRGCATGP